MFERFTRDARRVVELAQIEARELGHNWIGTEHLILALVSEDVGVATHVLEDSGVDAAAYRDLLQATIGTPQEDWVGDVDALRTIGIDLDEVRRRMEQTFGPGVLDDRQPGCKKGARWGHIPFTPKSKRALELSLREALRLGHKNIGGEHILLGLLRLRSALGPRLIEELGGSPDELRDRLLAELRRAS
jgi:ATP-dependent Clp protease ATP-binding subunit ClpA